MLHYSSFIRNFCTISTARRANIASPRFCYTSDYSTMTKRKRSAATIDSCQAEGVPIVHNARPRQVDMPLAPIATKLPRRRSGRGGKAVPTDPNLNPDIIDGKMATRASPDGHECAGDTAHLKASTPNGVRAAAPSEGINGILSAAVSRKKMSTKADARPNKVAYEEDPINAINGDEENVTGPAAGAGVPVDHEAANGFDAENEGEGEGEDKEALSRRPPVNSEYIPLPWRGRLGYACLNTYLRSANPPVFSSRTCRIASIIEHRHPLKDPSQPEHPTKNRPDRGQPADFALGQKYVEDIGLANARDIIKMVRWNDRYGIRFMRLSSEMFPFASHDEYGYKLEPFAAETLREAGKVIAELGHRVTTHPGQYTQLGSPRKPVIDNAIRDLAFHDELLSLLKLPPQQNRDAVMILHLGGAYGDKPAAVERFRENYAKLSQSVKNRLVLENDDVVWSVHELLPLCEELNIPMVLDFHHHNIVFDATQIREGTKDIMDLFPRILTTWRRKNITPKMHYSESCPPAITRASRRKHSPRVMTLPPCPDTMDLMIEAKDKEQAVFELMRTFKLPGFERFNDISPHTRPDENKPWKPKPKKAVKKSKKKVEDLENIDTKIEEEDEEDKPPPIVPDEEVGMGGPEGRVYWPPGMEDWLRPPKRIIKKNEEGAATPAKRKRKTAGATGDDASLYGESAALEDVKTPARQAAPRRATSFVTKKASKVVAGSGLSDDEDDQSHSASRSDLRSMDEDSGPRKRAARPTTIRKKSNRIACKGEADEMSM